MDNRRNQISSCDRLPFILQLPHLFKSCLNSVLLYYTADWYDAIVRTCSIYSILYDYLQFDIVFLWVIFCPPYKLIISFNNNLISNGNSFHEMLNKLSIHVLSLKPDQFLQSVVLHFEIIDLSLNFAWISYPNFDHH